MAFLGKVYKYQRQENFDGFLKSVGVPDDKIQALQAFSPTQQLEKNGDSYTLTTSTPEGTKKITFKPGVEFDDNIALDVTVKSIYTVDGNTVNQFVKGKEGNATFKKEFNGDELVVTITSENWDGVAHRYYKA